MIYTVTYEEKTKEFKTQEEAKAFFNHRLGILAFGTVDMAIEKKFFDDRKNEKRNFEIKVYTVNKFGNKFPYMEYSQFEMEQ